MSVRAIGGRLLRHGTAYVRILCRRYNNTTTIGDKINAFGKAPLPSAATGSNANTSSQVVTRNFALRNVGLQVGLHARKILIDNVLKRVTNTLAGELRKKAAKRYLERLKDALRVSSYCFYFRMLFGDSGPFFALVGVGLASGAGILTKEEELEGVCWEIRVRTQRFVFKTE